MKIRHRITYNKESARKPLIDFLKEKNAKFEKSNSYIGVAYLCEEDAWKEDLYRILRKANEISIVDVIYTKEEFEKAQWYSMRSKFRFEYPQPDDSFSYKSQTYDNSQYCSDCGCGLKQKDSFRLNRDPQWGQRHFLMLNWVHDELFTSTIAKECLINERITGIKFMDVLNHKKNTTFDDIHQIYIDKILEPGLVDLEQSVKEVLGCSSCGKTKYIGSGRGITYRKDVFSGVNLDAVKSFETFGDGLMCSRKIFVSKKLYQVLKNNKLDKDIAFAPIQFV
jgi:hypothetical protein